MSSVSCTPFVLMDAQAFSSQTTVMHGEYTGALKCFRLE